MSDLQSGAGLTERNAQALRELQEKFAGLTARVGVSNFDWRALMESGAIVTLRVARYRGTKALTAVDLGLDVEEMARVDSIVRLGHRLVLPAEILNEFNTLETRARQVVRGYGLLTPMGLFVPASSYAKLAAVLDDYKARFYALVDKLIVDLPTHRERMFVEYEALARQVHDRLVRSGVSVGLDFEQSFVDRCLATFPNAEQLRSTFEFRLSLDFVPLPYQSQTEQPEYAQATNDLVSMRRAVIAEQQSARSALVGEFISSVQSELYTLINSALSDVLASVRKNDNLQGKSVTQLRNLVSKLSDLNFWGDKTIETMQAEISALLDNPAGKRDASMSAVVLGELQAQARQVLIKLERADNTGLTLKAEQPQIKLETTRSAPLALNLNQPASNGAPNPNQYDNFGELADAVDRWQAEQPAPTPERVVEREAILTKLSGAGLTLRKPTSNNRLF